MLGKLLVSFLLSASPFGEMKIALPIAIHADGIDDWAALVYCIAGNLLVYPIVEFLMDNYASYMFRSTKVKRGLVKLRRHTKNKTEKLVQKYGFWGLLVLIDDRQRYQMMEGKQEQVAGKRFAG